MSYNMHVGIGMDKKLNLARIAEVINRERPDLLGLQEVDRGVERTGRVDEIAELARTTNMEYAFAPNLNYQGGHYGVAVLSRFPILAADHYRYANRREPERRGLIRVEVEIGGRRVNFVTTHLDYQHKDGRLFEIEQLMKILESIKTTLIVTGDFNDEPTEAAYVRDRVVSAVIFVNGETDDQERAGYGGGALAFFGLMDDGGDAVGLPLTGQAGLLVAFPAELVHGVLPVTRGERCTIATWFT